jgi:hypothetical protein
MGLDVIAVGKLTEYIGPYSEDLQNTLEQEYMEHGKESSVLVVNSDFPERLGDLKEGYYRFEGDMDHFAAGSYSGYGQWRRRLAERAWNIKVEVTMTSYGISDNVDYDAHVNDPFYELVWMSDCEGAIGPKVCADLAKDFAEWEDRMAELSANDDDPYYRANFMARYSDFRRCFELAAGGGVVVFR